MQLLLKKTIFSKTKLCLVKTSPLRRLHAQTLPDATPPLGKIEPFTKITVTFEPMKQFRCPTRFRIS